MQLAVLAIPCGPTQQREAIQRAPAQKHERERREVEVGRTQDGLPADEEKLSYPQEVAPPKGPEATFSQPDVARSSNRIAVRRGLAAPQPTQGQSFTPCHEPEGDPDTLPEWVDEGQKFGQQGSLPCDGADAVSGGSCRTGREGQGSMKGGVLDVASPRCQGGTDRRQPLFGGLERHKVSDVGEELQGELRKVVAQAIRPGRLHDGIALAP